MYLVLVTCYDPLTLKAWHYQLEIKAKTEQEAEQEARRQIHEKITRIQVFTVTSLDGN